MVPRYLLMAGCLMAALFLVAGVTYAKEHPGAEPATPVTLPDVTASALLAAFPEATLGKASKFEHDGLTFYAVEVTRGGAEMRVAVAPDGTIWSIRTPLAISALPDVVVKAFEKAYPGAEIRKTGRHEIRAEIRKVEGATSLVSLEIPRIEYMVKFVKDGKEQHVMVSEDGTVVRPTKWGGVCPVAPETPRPTEPPAR